MYIIYSKNGCPKCDVAKNMAKARNIPHRVKMLDVDYTIDEVFEIAGQPIRQMPYIINTGEAGTIRQVGSLEDFMKEVNN
jgi:glutaredoxin